MNQQETCNKIHYISNWNLLCFLDETKCDAIQVTTNPELITCQDCHYYYYHPEARILVENFRNGNK